MAWAGPPGESRPAPLTPRPAPTEAANNTHQFLWPKRTQVRDPGDVGDTGRGEVAPPSMSPWEPGEAHQH